MVKPIDLQYIAEDLIDFLTKYSEQLKLSCVYYMS